MLLAKTLGYGFLDTDLVLQRREGALLQEVLDRRGLAAFLDAEEAAIRSVDCARTVIAPGGSAVCRPGAIATCGSWAGWSTCGCLWAALEGRVTTSAPRGIAMCPRSDPGRRLRRPRPPL